MVPPGRASEKSKVASKTLLIDGNSLIHRAYHALPAFTTSSGQPTNAAFGFVQMLLALLEAEQPDVAILAMDAPGPTFRHELDPSYKADRPEMEEDLAAQLGTIRELAEALGMVITELPGYEADDIIGALATKAAERGDEVLVVSGDRDMVQLVAPALQVLATIKGFTDTKRYDEAAVREEYGVDPSAVADLKGLAGDSSDNIPGVPGVGPKTAAALLSQFGTVEDLYARLDETPNEKTRALLAEHEQAARLSVRLARIARDAPVDEGLLDLRREGLDLRRLRKLLGQLESIRLLERLPPGPTSGETTLAAHESDVGDLCARAREAPVVGIAVALDGETATGIAVATDEQRAAYIPLPSPGEELGLFRDEHAAPTADCLRALLQNEDVAKAGHDLKGVARALATVGIVLRGLAFDAGVAAYLAAPQRGEQDLELLVAQHFGESVVVPDASGDEGLPGPGLRAGAEARAALRLRAPLTEQLEAAGAMWLFTDIEMPLVAILRDMEAVGIAVDLKRLDETGDKLSGLMSATAERAHKLAGGEFNLDSPRQVAEVLFERLKLPRGRKTKTGWSTSAEVLEELAPDHEIAALILQYREYAKLKSTYVDALMRLASPHDDRVRTTFEQAVVATGRLSSRNPNLQNIPVRTEWGREIRSCFVAGDPDNVLLAADYSQIELRILAHMSHDESLLQAFREGRDIHSATAAAIFDVATDDVGPDMRRVAKTVNYAVIYGMGSVALARQLGIKRPEAQQFIDGYFERLPQVRAYMEQTVARAREDGYVQTLLGRRRPTPELRSRDQRTVAYGERAAANAPLQGSAADIIKVAMVRLAPKLPSRAPHCTMLLQVHDELVFELPRRDVQQAAAVIREVMQNAATLDVPLVVDVKVGANWRDMERL